MRRKSIIVLGIVAAIVMLTSAVGATMIWDNINGPVVSDYPGIHAACGTPAEPQGELTPCELEYVTNNNN